MVTLPTTVDTTDVVLLSSVSGSLADIVSLLPLLFFLVSSPLGILDFWIVLSWVGPY